MIACGMMDFESIMRAIGSNTGRWGYSDCRLTLRRQDKSVPRARPEKSIEEVGEAGLLKAMATKGTTKVRKSKRI